MEPSGRRRHGLTQDGPERGRRGPARVAEVDLVMPAGHREAVGRDVLLVHATQQLGLVVEGPDVERLHALPLGEGLQPHVPESR